MVAVDAVSWALWQQANPALATGLRRLGFVVRRHALYATIPLPALAQPAHEALAAGQIRACLFYSPASGRAFAAALLAGLPGEVLAKVEALAISAATAAAICPLPWRRIRVASHPDQAHLLELLAGETP